MLDARGRPIAVGDLVKVGGDMTGHVVCSIDTREGSPGNPIEQWDHLLSGLMVHTDQAGLIHVTDSTTLRLLRPYRDVRSVPELFAAATDWAEGDGEGDWYAVHRLHDLGGREVLNRALELVKSADPRSRARAADILGQLGIPDRTFPNECLTTVLELIGRDTDPVVLQAAAVALGHLHDPRGIKALAGIANHPDPEVRHGVAFALAGHAEPAAITALIHLTQDEVANVRDWATFGLGELGTVNTPAVRDALYQRLADDDDDTRFEALCGLARCGDIRAVQPLVERLMQQPEDTALPRAAKLLLQIPETEEITSDELIERLRRLSISEGK